MSLFLSCSLDDDSNNECIGVIDFIGPPSFLIELLDEDGNNLIENGFFPENQITAIINGEPFNSKVANPDFLDIENVVFLSSAESAENNRWLLKLSETDTDTLDFSLTFKEVRQGDNDNGFLCGTFATLVSANYNGIEINIDQISDTGSFFPITVIK